MQISNENVHISIQNFFFEEFWTTFKKNDCLISLAYVKVGKSSKQNYKTKVIRANLLNFYFDFDFDFDFEDIIIFGKISVLVTFQFW